MNPTCDKPGCGLEMEPDEVFHLRWVCPRNADAHALAAKLAESEAKVRELEDDVEKEERAHLDTIRARDTAEEALGEAYQLVMDEWPEWSSDFGFKDALDAMNERLGADMRERESLKSERDEARSQLNALEEQLLSVLPEDFGAVEYIKSLESQLRAAQSEVNRLKDELDKPCKGCGLWG